MLIQNIKLMPGKVLVQPTADNSSFSVETNKYDRKNIGIIKGVSKESGEDDELLDFYLEIKTPELIGRKVVYDDSHSIDFSIDGVSLSIIGLKDIVAVIKEGD